MSFLLVSLLAKKKVTQKYFYNGIINVSLVLTEPPSFFLQAKQLVNIYIYTQICVYTYILYERTCPVILN